MSVASRIQAIEEHMGDIYDTLEVGGSDLTNVDKNIVNINSELRKDLLYYLNNGVDVVWNNWDKVTGTGESLTLNQTLNAPMKLSLKGNTSQTGTPTPDSPQPINVVSGDNTIEVVGKNLAYTSWASDFVSRVSNTGQAKLETYDGKNCLLYQYSVGSGDYDNKYIFKTNWKENTQYTISYRLYANYSPNITIIYTDGTQTTIPRSSITINTWNNVSITSTANKTIKQIQGYAEGGYDYIDLDTFMVYEGTETIPYQPYQSQTYPIYLPVENILNANDTYNFVASGTSPTTIGSIDLVANTKYYISYTIDTATTSNTRNTPMFEFNGTNYYQYSTPNTNLTTGRKVWEFTPTTSGTYNFRYWCHTLSNDISISHFMISTINASYTPYGTTPIELNKIGTYQDYFYKDSGKWYLHKEIGKVVLDGSQDYLYSSYYTAIVYSDSSIKNVGADEITIKSNKAIGITANQILNNNGIAQNTGSNRIFVKFDGVSNYNTNELIKQYFSSNNYIVYYILSTPTDTEITYQPLINQLEAIRQAYSYEGQTNIGQENNDKPFILDVTALEDWR